MFEVEKHYAGYCKQLAKISDNSKGLKVVDFKAYFVVIKNIATGKYTLFDTGYSPLFYKYTKVFPYNIYGYVTKVYCGKNESAYQILKRKGINPLDIEYIIISHFHADHIGGLKYFKKARFICSYRGYKEVINKSPLGQVYRGFIKGLMPNDFKERAIFIESLQGKVGYILGFKMIGLMKGIKIFSIEGHTKGQIGAYVMGENGKKFLLIADGCWSKNAYENLSYPNKTAKIITYNWKKYVKNIAKINKIYINNEDIEIICSHDD